MDGSSSYLARPLRSEAEVLAEFEGLPAVWPPNFARHCSGHNASIVIFLRWAAGQPRSFTRDDVKPDRDLHGRIAMQCCIDNDYLEVATYSRNASGLIVDRWRVSAKGAAVLARADAFEREGRVF